MSVTVPINQILKTITIPHSLLYAPLHHIGPLWLQQDLLYHLPSHQDKQLPRHNQYSSAWSLFQNTEIQENGIAQKEKWDKNSSRPRDIISWARP
jgi:hypothetical protein